MARSISIGNSAYLNEEGKWDWTLYVRPPDLIEGVIAKLHPTFRNPIHHLKSPNLELQCTGWGTFEIDLTICWKGGSETKTAWMLKFDERQPDHHKEFLVPDAAIPASIPSGISQQQPSLHCESKPQIPRHNDELRIKYLSTLQQSPAIDPGADSLGKSWHGRLVQKPLPPPNTTWQSRRKPREDKHGNGDAPDWLDASEYRDDPQSFAYKVHLLADLLRSSQKTLAYTGAGLSVAAGIEMAAVGSSKAKKASPLAADPTVAHCIMAELNNNDLLHGWVQQNHDGLPQKAGYRQEDINEIHGSWYDPSNPVVLYSGSLRHDLFQDMQDWAKTADLVLVLGTSLSGLNADQCVTKAALRSMPERSKSRASLGSVIISPQRTPEDGNATLRIFATADEVMTQLAKEFNLQARLEPDKRRAQFHSELRVKVPYDRHGRKSSKVCTWWDLRPGAKLRVSKHNNIEGAQQPAYLNITPDTEGQALPQNDKTCCISVRFDDRTSMQLGMWWIDAALRGGPEYLPLVNCDAMEEKIVEA